jgi:anaerobic selenocysteine-containing dehydrogenase
MSQQTVLGTCHHDCPDSCGWVATVEDGVAVKLRGNPDHPYSRGQLCPKVNLFLDRVYSPDRVLHPLIRVGAKGEGRFEEVSWEDALEQVAMRFHQILDRFGGEAILPWWDAGTQGLIQMSSLDRRLFGALGATELTGSLCGATAGAGFAATTGSGKGSDPSDVQHSNLVILWATNTKLTNRHLWPFIEKARANGATVVVIDPMRTATAEAADWFLQPRPGTDTALMLAMMHVLIRDSLIDEDYVTQHTTGFDELAKRVADWQPRRAAEVCGIEVGDIERLATMYGSSQPAMIRTLIGAEHHENGAMFFRTLACLPTLTGSWKHLGGGLARSTGVYADANVDDSVFNPEETTERRKINMNHLGRALTDRSLDPPIAALVVWNGNPVVTVPNAELIREGLEQEDLFTVVSEQFVTDTARYADVIFPATTQIEQLDVVPAWGHMYLGWNNPAIAPRGESVPNTELWRRLATALGLTDPELFQDDESLLLSALHGVDIDAMRSVGFVRLDIPQEVLPYASGEFATVSGKAELFSEALQASGHDPLPGFVPSTESVAAGGPLAERFPLTLLTPKHHVRFLNSSYTHLPKHGPREGAPFMEMNAADAEVRGLATGDRANVWNDRSTLELEVRVTDRLRPGVVAVPFGWWGSDHNGTGATANSLTSDTLTDWGGGVAFSDTLVVVARS